MSHRYRAYGLAIASSFEIPEIPVDESGGAEPDITISVGAVPNRLDGIRAEGPSYQASNDELLLEIEDVGRYLVSRGTEITIEPHTATDHDLRVFLLGTCFGALLHQRGALVLHASGIGTPDGAILFAGHSGAGKSTLLSEMLRRGYRMMVDDVTAIRTGGTGGALIVESSYPRTRIWGETADHMSIETKGLRRTRAHLDKYERQLPDLFWEQPARLQRIYWLVPADLEQPELTAIAPMLAMKVIRDNTYRKMFLEPFGLRQNHFRIASEIARTVPVVLCARPTASFQVSELADMVIGDMGQDSTS